MAGLTPAANASQYIQKGIADDTQILYGNPDKVFPTLQQMGTKLVRVNLWWGGPGLTVASRRPLNPANPKIRLRLGDLRPHGRLRPEVRDEGRLLDPRHAALGERRPRVERRAHEAVGPEELRHGRGAALRRHVRRPGRREAARVPDWLVWNEPNNPVFLKPQYDTEVRRARPGRSSRAALRRPLQRYPSQALKSRQPGLQGRLRRHRAAREQPTRNSPRALGLPACRSCGRCSRRGSQGVRRLRAPPVLRDLRAETPSTPPAPAPRGQPADRGDARELRGR